MAADYRDVDFGEGYGGIATVGFTLYASDGSVLAVRSTAGVVDRGHGVYGALVTIPDGAVGTIYWDTAPGSSVHAAERFDLSPAAVAPASVAALVDAVAARIVTDHGAGPYALDAAGRNRIADHVLRRSTASAFASTDGDPLELASLYGTTCYLVHAIQDPDGGRIVIYNPDGSVLGERNLDVDPDALPVVGVHA